MGAIPLNQLLPLDFMADQITEGRRFRALSMVCNGTRDCLAIIASTPLFGAQIARELVTIITQRGRPGMIIHHDALCSERLANFASGPFAVERPPHSRDANR